MGFSHGVLQYSAKPIDEWYKAAARFNELVNTPDPRWRLQRQLQPGELLSKFNSQPVLAHKLSCMAVFDNWRVLHGRTAFTGKRRMSGAYINRDDFISRWKNANFSRDDILRFGIY